MAEQATPFALAPPPPLQSADAPKPEPFVLAPPPQPEPPKTPVDHAITNVNTTSSLNVEREARLSRIAKTSGLNVRSLRAMDDAQLGTLEAKAKLQQHATTAPNTVAAMANDPKTAHSLSDSVDEVAKAEKAFTLPPPPDPVSVPEGLLNAIKAAGESVRMEFNTLGAQHKLATAGDIAAGRDPMESFSKGFGFMPL